jgi:hypothetical protein
MAVPAAGEGAGSSKRSPAVSIHEALSMSSVTEVSTEKELPDGVWRVSQDCRTEFQYVKVSGGGKEGRFRAPTGVE